jgi:hypothetical protein
LPYDPSSCDGAIQVYAFIDGECQPRVHGGCNLGNENQFPNRRECERHCLGYPQQQGCPVPNTTPAVSCTRCGFGGGCSEYGTVCAKRCSTDGDCANSTEPGLVCFDSACVVQCGP